MNEEQPSKELRLKSGSTILSYIRRFSPTEKAVFAILAVAAIVTAIAMLWQIDSYFLVTIPAYGGTLREGEVGLPRTVNPVLAVTDADRDISSLVYAGLTTMDSQGNVQPALAQSWTVSPDGLTYDFILRPDVRFQDGTPLTADDVAFTIEKIQDPALKSPRAADWANVTVQEVSPTEIKFVLKTPYAPFLSNTSVGILPKHIWSTVGDDQFIYSQSNIQPIGAGPYKVASISHDSGGIPTGYRLTAWSGYYGKMPYISTLLFSFFSDEDKALAALQQGAIDSLASIPPENASSLVSASAEPYTLLSAPLPRIFGVFWNQSQNPALADPGVRKALDMSADRNGIVATVLDGYGLPIDGPVPPQVAGAGAVSASLSSAASANGSATSTATSSALLAAQALLQKNGWAPDPTTGIYEKKAPKGSKASTITLSFDIYTADTPDLEQTAEILKTDWTALGAQVDVKAFDPSDLYENVISTRDYDALLFGEQIGAGYDLYPFWDSSQRNPPGLNVAMYANSKADKLLEDIRSTASSSERAADYAQVGQIVSDDEPAAFLYVPDFIYAVPATLQGIGLGTISMPSDRFNSIADWYIETERVWKIFAKD